MFGGSSLELKTVYTLDHTLLSAIPIPALVVDDDVRIVDMNTAAAQLCNRDPGAVYQCRGGEALHCVHSTDVSDGCGRAPFCQQCVIRSSVMSCLHGQAISHARMSMISVTESGKKTRELLVTASPLSTNPERLALLVIEDITVYDELEQALRRSEKFAAAGRLLATMAHEINNPLDSLSSLLYLIRAEPGLTQSAKKFVESAEKEVERIATITRQTLAPHRETASPVNVRLSELLDDVLAVFRRRLDTARINVSRDYQTDGEVSIYPNQFWQVFTNLIANAIDAVGSDGTLSVLTEQLPDAEMAVRISDSGCGIPPEHLNTIFDPFFTTKGEKGTGIGLWVIKGIVEKAGGRIEVVSSTTGKKGTCFSIFLPLIPTSS